jgi:hypothetical protein
VYKSARVTIPGEGASFHVLVQMHPNGEDNGWILCSDTMRLFGDLLHQFDLVGISMREFLLLSVLIVSC